MCDTGSGYVPPITFAEQRAIDMSNTGVPPQQPTNYQVPQQPTSYEVQQQDEPTGQGLRIFQILTAVTGAVLFVAGLVAVFRVDFGVGFFDTTGDVAGFGFSPALAIAAVLLGGFTMAAALADQDRGSTAFIGLLTLLVGIGAMVAGEQIPEDVDIDRRAAGLFVALGAVIFVLSLIPWWGRRRRSTVVR